VYRAIVSLDNQPILLVGMFVVNLLILTRALDKVQNGTLCALFDNGYSVTNAQ
jgi:hypothetical protein